MGGGSSKRNPHTDIKMNTPSHGNPGSTNALNSELNNVARNTNDTDKARRLVDAGADLSSTNGPTWRHTPLHQAAFHGRYDMAKTLVQLGAPLELHSNPCGRGHTGTPLELARGGGHHRIAEMLEEAMAGRKPAPLAKKGAAERSGVCGALVVHEARYGWASDIWKAKLGGGHNHGGGAKDVTGIVRGLVTNDELHINAGRAGQYMNRTFWPETSCGPAIPRKLAVRFSYDGGPVVTVVTPAVPNETVPLHVTRDTKGSDGDGVGSGEKPKIPSGFRFAGGYGEATRKDQIGHITSGGVEGHCFQGDKMRWPLQWAAMIGDVQAIRTLTAAGHDPNVKMTCWFDSEPLGWAASFGQCKAIIALCDAGADPARPANHAGNTPLADAQREGHTNAIKLVQEYLHGTRKVGSSKHGQTTLLEPEPSAPQPATLAAPVGERACGFVRVNDSAFDTAGVLYGLATGWGTRKYANPADSGTVSVRWSHDAANYYSTAGGHKVGDAKQAARVICEHTHPGANATMWSKGAPKAYFEIDLQTVEVRPTTFAYRNDYGGGGNHPRSFELQGSNDGASWTTLSKHTSETWSKGKGAKAWEVNGVMGYYRVFRIQNFGAPNHLCCSGLELYGVVRSVVGEKPAQATVIGNVKDLPTIATKIKRLQTELHVEPSGRSLAEDAKEIVETLGVSARVKGKPLVEQVNLCYDEVFGAAGAPEIPMGVPIA